MSASELRRQPWQGRHAARARGFDEPCAARLWWERYRAPGEDHVDATWTRVARALARPEGPNAARWMRRFRHALAAARFLPAGRILAGAGRPGAPTLANCFVMGELTDELPTLCARLAEGAQTLRDGGGVGFDFSPLRPAATASGVVSWLAVWDAMCAAVAGSARRGAMMATLRCDHPDIEAFVTAKAQPGALQHFNLSVLVSEAFVAAVRADAEWPLVHPSTAGSRVFALRRARALWRLLTRNAWAHAEPGVLFIDRINAENNLAYREVLTATNPCGEVPLPSYGACHLGSLNLVSFVREPYTTQARIDQRALAASAALAVRLLDNAVTCSTYPLAAQRDAAHASRRIGLGVTGLADTLILLGLRYDSDAARTLARTLLTTIRDAAYWASVSLAREKGAFPLFEAEPFLAGPYACRLPGTLRAAIAQHGLRNSHLLAIAPTGSISLLAGNVSAGIEPVIAAWQRRAIRDIHGELHHHRIGDHACRAWRRLHRGLPPAYVGAADLAPGAHIAMLASLQPLVDQGIAKTVNLPASTTAAACTRLFEAAHDAGLKGLTVYRAGTARGGVVAAAGGRAPPAA